MQQHTIQRITRRIIRKAPIGTTITIISNVFDFAFEDEAAVGGKELASDEGDISPVVVADEPAVVGWLLMLSVVVSWH